MTIALHERFENHMDVVSLETMGDAEKVSDFFDEDPYDDNFEIKLSQVNNIDYKEYSPEIVEENAEETTNQAQEKSSGKNVSDLALNPTRPPLSDSTETEDNMGQAIESIGSDEDNQVEFVGEQSESNSEKVTDENGIRSESGDNPSNSLDGASDTSESELKKNIVFRAIADANPDYGVGGGTQYFIQYASDLKRDGRLKQQSSPEILSLDEKEILKADIRDSKYSNYTIHLDKRNMTEKDAQQMFDSSSDSTSSTLFNIPDSISEDELKYLDENTIATEGITDINDEFFMNEEGKRDSHEDYLRPHGNQEDSKGKTMPDSWSNPEKLEEGKIYYQLSPLFSDGNQDTKSSYFTDEETVNVCRDENGVINVSTLLQKLQIEAKKEVVQYDNGKEKEVYVNKYVLSSYVYTEKPTG